MKNIGLAVLVPAIFIVASISSQPELFEEAVREKRSSGKGIYITASMARARVHFEGIIARAKSSGIDTIVIDAKRDLQGPFLELIREKKLDKATKAAPNPWLAKLVKELHGQGFIATARLVVFKDDHLAIARPDLAVRSKSGTLYRDFKQGRWVDPYSDEVRLYNELIAESAALSGIDEVQFDYIRFPAEGDTRNVVYSFEKEGLSRVDVICQFLADVRERLNKYNTSIGVDIFGVTAWQNRNDIEGLGQDLKRMSEHIDVISPMFYPSHFHSGYDGFENPGSHPYYFVNIGVKKTRAILGDSSVKIVPWLQGFNLRSPNFGPNYLQEQVRACRDEGVEGYLIWNAANNYATTFAAFLGK